MKNGVNSQADAEMYLKYLDGATYVHNLGFNLEFNEGTPTPFRIREDNNGNLKLADHAATKTHEVLCQYDCQGKVRVDARWYSRKLSAVTRLLSSWAFTS